MKPRFLLLLFIGFILLICSCDILDRNVWVHNGIRSKRIQKKYLSEPLIFSSFIYYHNEDKAFRKVDSDFLKNQDSVIWRTKKSILNSNLKIQFDDSLKNKVTPAIIEKMGNILRPRNIHNTMILSHIVDSQTYIFPVIYSYTTSRYHVGAFYPTPDNDFFGWTEYLAMVFIIKNKKVIYKRAVRYSELHTQTGPAITDYRSDVRLEHLGLIVEKAMEDYIKRIKKEE